MSESSEITIGSSLRLTSRYKYVLSQQGKLTWWPMTARRSQRQFCQKTCKNESTITHARDDTFYRLQTVHLLMKP